jgi:probable rRNA maturation factor
MPVKVELTISENIDTDNMEIPDEKSFQLWAESACLDEDDTIASLQVVGSDEMRALNKTYRDKDVPTNVLSFPMQLPAEVDIKILGDLALCVNVIDEEAKVQGKSLTAHWAHMVIHGMLHLQGYDHIDDGEAETMETMEIDILKKLGFDNPYSVH